MKRLANLATIFTALLVVGCTVALVPAYDDQIDSGLSQINTDVTAFVNKMIGEAGTSQGTWASNKDFYTVEEAKADTLIVRAQAHRALNNCPSTMIASDAVKAMGTQSSQVQQYLTQLPQDDCFVQLLTLVKKGIVDLETFHKDQGNKGIPASAHDPLLVGGVGSIIHSAMTVELAMKNNSSPTSAGGK